MFGRTCAVLLLTVSLFAPTALGSVRGRDDQGSLSERIVRFLKTHIPPMFVTKPADDPIVVHP